ncbi:hypothetical protein MASR2M15_00100 [Anaerolineales bacterium]
MSRVLLRPTFIGVALYLVFLGATFHIGVQPPIKLLSVILLTILSSFCLLAHFLKHWDWHRSPFDLALLLWLAALLLSTSANPDPLRRTLLASWYMLLYILFYYGLNDLLANRAIHHELMVQTLNLTAVLLVIFGLIQTFMILTTTGELIRPEALFGNTNAYANVLIMLIPFGLIRIFQTTGLSRLLFFIHSLLATVLVILSQSRGSWLGYGVMLLSLLILFLYEKDYLSVVALKKLWHSLSQFKRMLVISGLSVCAITLLFMGIWFYNSFSASGRSLNLRTYIWDFAIEQFQANPLTGTGLFTFGRELPLADAGAVPPRNVHSHAHSLPLNIAAEMGVFGLIALAASFILLIKALRSNWKQASSKQRTILIPAIAALLGTLTHYLIDLPVMMPIIALIALFILVLATTPFNPKPILNSTVKRLYGLTAFLLTAGIIITGFWGAYTNFKYIQLALTMEHTEDFIDLALGLDQIIALDPQMPIYYEQQALAFAIAASEAQAADQTTYLLRSVESFQTFLSFEPYYSLDWANLAAVYASLGDLDQAQQAIQQALDLAPDYEWYLQMQSLYQGDIQRIPAQVKIPIYAYHGNMQGAQFLRLATTPAFVPQLFSRELK